MACPCRTHIDRLLKFSIVSVFACIDTLFCYSICIKIFYAWVRRLMVWWSSHGVTFDFELVLWWIAGTLRAILTLCIYILAYRYQFCQGSFRYTLSFSAGILSILSALFLFSSFMAASTSSLSISVSMSSSLHPDLLRLNYSLIIVQFSIFTPVVFISSIYSFHRV